MVEIGKPAPDFSLLDQNGKKVTLSKLKGSPVVLYFYPKDDTPGCTTEACSFRDESAAFKKKGAVILGVSPDDTDSHAKFAKKFDLPFSLLADVGNKICDDYGVWKEKNMYGQEVHGRRANDLRHRRQGDRAARLRQSEGRRPFGRGARGARKSVTLIDPLVKGS